MEKLRSAVAKIATTADEHLPNLPLRQRTLIPFLSFASFIYRLSISLRSLLYLSALIPRHRLPVPVISVGNLTWGGNGKTPMVEYVARYLDELGISPLILSRGYAGGDEAKMLERHLLHTAVKIGVGANRSAIAAAMFERYGVMDLRSQLYSESLLSPCKLWSGRRTQMIGAVILDDGMQHWSLFRNVEVVMINGLSPWGNKHLIPRGSLREPLESLRRAHIGVIHHADLVGSTLCVGSEWHRYPSSFFVPSYVSEVRWVDDGFRGLLPFPFNSTLGGTASAPPYFNDKNKASDKQYLQDVESCALFVELDLRRPYLSRGSNLSKWETLAAVHYLDREFSPAIYRSYFIPYLWHEKNVFGLYKLLRKITS